MCVRGVSLHFGRLVSRFGFRQVFCPVLKIGKLLRPVKDGLGLRVPGVHSYRYSLTNFALVLRATLDGLVV